MMNDNDIQNIITSATMVVQGYAFSRMDDGNVRIVGLKGLHHATVMRPDGEALETSMDDVELEIIKECWERNKKYMVQEEYAEVL